jgi:hypothetical protein
VNGAITALVLAAALGCAMTLGWRGYRRHRLRVAFGAEYDLVVQASGSPRAGRRELIRRRRRHRALRVRAISPGGQNAYALAWEDLQARFTDDPQGAVEGAERLVEAVVTARGYPATGRDERLALLSVEHSTALGRYRQALSTIERARSGTATTEELRIALAQIRTLFGDLLMTPRPALLR